MSGCRNSRSIRWKRKIIQRKMTGCYRDRLTRVVALKEGCREEEVEVGEVEEAPAKENGEGFASELVKVHICYCTL